MQRHEGGGKVSEETLLWKQLSPSQLRDKGQLWTTNTPTLTTPPPPYHHLNNLGQAPSVTVPGMA